MKICTDYGHRWESDVYELGGVVYVEVWCDYCDIEMSFEQEVDV